VGIGRILRNISVFYVSVDERGRHKEVACYSWFFGFSKITSMPN
jgi:hypothetical protein